MSNRRRFGLWTRALDGIVLDARHAVRMFRRRPAVVAVTVLGLALAIGFSSAIFGLMQALFLPPLGVADPDTAVSVGRMYANGRSSALLYESRYRQLSDAVSLLDLEGWWAQRAVYGDAGTEEARVGVVSGGFFHALGVEAAVGRVLSEGDDDPAAPPVMVINHTFWQRRLGADEAIIGQTIALMGMPFTVVGVLAPDFYSLDFGRPEFWVPAALHRQVWGLGSDRELMLRTVGRIQPGATWAQAEDELSAAVAALAPDWSPGEIGPEVAARFEPIDHRYDGSGGTALRWVIGTILSILGLILLLACANVANLLLANATRRHREIGVRLALGAGRLRLVRQMLTESVMLGAVSGIFGLLLAFWFAALLDGVAQFPATLDPSPDARGFVFTLVFTLLAGIGAGLAPARYGAHGDVMAPLKGAPKARGGGRPGRARTRLVAVQAATSIVLLLLAALLGRSMLHVANYDLGIDIDRLVRVQTDLTAAGYDHLSAVDYWRRVTQRVNGLPGVESSALVSHAPYGDSYGRMVEVQAADAHHTVYFNNASAEYFATMGIGLLRGRTYTVDEVARGEQVAVIGEGLERALWRDEPALGSTLERVAEDLAGVRVVGIVEDTSLRLEDLDAHVIYRPVVGADAYGSMLRTDLIVRAAGAPEAVTVAVREAVIAAEPRAVPRIALYRDELDASFQLSRMYATLAAFLGSIALGLACTGVFGVTAFVVEQRRAEIGLRLAVGASPRDVVRLMLRDNLRPVIVGLAVGLLGALAGARILTAALFGISPYDPLALGGAILALLGTAVLAAGSASRRAARVDPALVLERG